MPRDTEEVSARARALTFPPSMTTESEEDVLRALHAYAHQTAGSAYAMSAAAYLTKLVLAPHQPKFENRIKFDVQQLLEDLVMPRLSLVEQLWGRMPGWLATGHVGSTTARWLTAATARLTGEYEEVCARMLPRVAAHVTQSETQRLCLLFLFQAMLGMCALDARVQTAARQERPIMEWGAPDFDYVEHVGTVRVGGFPLANAGDLPLGRYNLTQWHTAMDLLCKALHTMGSGGGGLPDARPYWDALWERYAELLFLPPARADSVTDARAPPRPTPSAPPAAFGAGEIARILAGMGMNGEEAMRARADAASASTMGSLLNLKYASEPMAERSDVARRRLTRALPYEHGGRRLCLVYCQGRESLFRTHHLRFKALHVFAEAARAPASVAATTMMMARMPANIVAPIAAFIEEMADHRNDTVDRFVSEELWANYANAYLMAGEVERFVLLALDAAIKATGTVPVNASPFASEVISTMRGEEWPAIARLDARPVLLNKVRNEFLPSISARGPPLVAPFAERAGVMLLSVMLDAAMTFAGCPGTRLLSQCSYVDELAHGFKHLAGHSAKAAATALEAATARQALPMSPRAALDVFGGRAARAVVVRLMRRNFLVMARKQYARDPLVLELPSYPHAMLGWLASAAVPVSDTEGSVVPPIFQPLVDALRAA